MSEGRTFQVDLCVIGAGPGGYVAAISAAKRGLSVVLCEKEFIGGTCLNVGCIPTKALIHAADLVQLHKEAKSWGIDYSAPAFDLGSMIDKKDQIVKTLTDGISQLLKHHGVTVIQGIAAFASDHEIRVTSATGESIVLAKYIIVATGSKTKHLSIPGIDLENVVDSTGLLQTRSVPKRLVVIGGGVIGMEFAFLFGRLGSQVKVLEFLPSILPSVDKDLTARLLPWAKRNNVSVQTQASVSRIDKTDSGLAVSYSYQGALQTIEADMVLEAVGRIAQTTALGLENTSIIYNAKGINVDDQFETNVQGIYAIGDVNGLWQLAHAASHQALFVVDRILGNTHTPTKWIPSIVYTTPILASVGLTEAEATKQGFDHRIVKVPYGANGKALIQDAQGGFVKLVVENSSSKVIGAHVFGADADHLIASLTYLLSLDATVEAVQETIVAHPSVEELIHEAYLGIDGLAIHYLDR